MSVKELDAAGIDGAALRASYERCRAIAAAHGKTYFLATTLLPKAKRPFVHALYGLARQADEIVDDMRLNVTHTERVAAFESFFSDFFRELDQGFSVHPVRAAAIDTAIRWQIPVDHFEAFAASMRMDLSTTRYATYDDLYRYTYGSGAVVGLQLVPILGTSSPEAMRFAGELGVAFQLANFIRDVGEDLDRGRVYLPLDELARVNVSVADLQECHRVGRTTDDVRSALAFQIERVRALEQSSRTGIALLHPSSRPCIDAARVMYCGIVDEVERRNYEIFGNRLSVSRLRRFAIAVPAWRDAKRATRRFGPGEIPAAVPRTVSVARLTDPTSPIAPR